jgi:hypothetical protein
MQRQIIGSQHPALIAAPGNSGLSAIVPLVFRPAGSGNDRLKVAFFPCNSRPRQSWIRCWGCSCRAREIDVY